MSNENENVEQANIDIRQNIRKAVLDAEDEGFECLYTVFEVVNMIDRILAAHKRELAAKDAEIARLNEERNSLVNIINTECNKCGDCQHFYDECDAGSVDGNEDRRACSRFISKREFAKDGEITKRDVLIKELADALDKVLPENADCCDVENTLCKDGCMPNGKCNIDIIRALAAKAREVVK